MEIVDFWRHLPKAAIDESKSILQFKSNNPLSSQDPNTPRDKMFVRQDYVDLWDLMLKSPSKMKGSGRFIITGTPGVGKSMFLFYILWMLSKDPVARDAGIVYTTKNGDHYIFSDEVVLGPFKDDTIPIFRHIIGNRNAR